MGQVLVQLGGSMFGLMVGFAGGFAACWFFRDKFVTWYRGADATIKALEAKIAALKP